MKNTDCSIASSSTSAQSLAIVGIGCRFPGGVTDLASYWELLSSGRDGIREVPRERWDTRSFYSADPEAPGKMYVRHAGFIDQDIRSIDAEFFGISPREAASMDPQQRLLMEVCWEALDDAGIAQDRLAGSSTGVFVGAFTLDNLLAQMNLGDRARIGAHSATGSTATILSNRLSYFLDLRGPSLSVDTACSSSLVALHLASQALAKGDCELALVGGVSVIFRPEYMIAMCKGQFLAPDGRSKSFDARANGYGRGEGAGMVVVKPLARALQDGDRIHAVVRATGCNQDGRTNGITVPNPDSQKALIRAVLRDAQVDARQVRYVEAHGTGTPVGDPLEAQALGEALGDGRSAAEQLVIGSVKANIGHLEAAAGIAGLIKLCAIYAHGAIPPIANLQTPNPAIPFDRLGLRLASALEPLPAGEAPILCGINSFGYGGTNAHAILESAPAAAVRADAGEPGQAPVVLPVSARSGKALQELVLSYRQRLADTDLAPALLAANAGTRRAHLEHRAAFVGRDRQQLQQSVDDWLALSAGKPASTAALDAAAARPVFVFSGMGPQWWAMGRQLRDAEPIYAAFLERVDAIFRELSGWSLLEEMGRDKELSRIRRTEIAQPANFALQAGLFELLRAKGIEAAAVVGHSVGEVSAAYAAGVLSLQDAVRVSYHRSRLQARAAGQGAMLAVGLTHEEAKTLIASFGGRVCIAAINAPKAVTLAGEADVLQEIAARLEVKAIFNRMLQVEVAYHSQFMDPLRQPLIDALEGIAPRAPSLEMYSTVTGKAVEGIPCAPEYWAENVREPVYFMQAMDAMIAAGHRVFLEIGPHPVLSGSMREILARGRVPGHVVSTLEREQDEARLLAGAMARLYELGYGVDWARINGTPQCFTALPKYPWQRDLMWNESELAPHQGSEGVPCGMAGARLAVPEMAWERTLNEQFLPYLHDHVVQGLTLLPGAGFVDAALAIQREIGADAFPLSAERIAFQRPLVFDQAEERVLRGSYDPSLRKLVFHSRGGQQGDWQRHAEAVLARPAAAPCEVPLDELRARFTRPLAIEQLYERLAGIGLQYGPQFRCIEWLASEGDAVLARVGLPQLPADYDIAHVIHPLLLDGAFQSLLAALDVRDGAGYVPATIGRVSVFATLPDTLWCYGRIEHRAADHVLGSLVLYAQSGEVVATVEGIRCAAVVSAALSRDVQVDKWLSRLAWRAAPAEPAERRTGAWLLLGEGGFGPTSDAGAVARRLEQAGCERVLRIGVGGPVEQGDAALFWVDDERGWDELLLQYPPAGLAGIAYFASSSGSQPVDATVSLATRLWRLFRKLPDSGAGPRVSLVTRNACAVAPGDAVDGFREAAGIGFMRVAHNEFPALDCSTIDHDGSPLAIDRLGAELLGDPAEDAIALRGGARYTQRVEYISALDLEREQVDAHLAPLAAGAARVLERTHSSQACGQRKDSLFWRACGGDAEPGAGQVAIDVAYFGIDAQGVAETNPAEALATEALREFCGRIAAVGAESGTEMSGWQVGDRVAGSAVCRIASRIVVDAKQVFRVAGESAPSAASARIALTDAPVRYALTQRAAARHGERALVYGARGALGEATLACLREAGLDVCLADSGDTGSEGCIDLTRITAAAELDARFAAQGADLVVFCSRPAAAVEVRIPLSPHGRVLVFASGSDPDGLAACLRVIDAAREIHVVDPHCVAQREPAAYAALCAELGARCGSGADDVPRRSPMQLVGQALAAEGGAAWFALDMSEAAFALPADDGGRAGPAATCLITGGFGGFGLAVAEHLVGQGTRRLILTGRSGASGEAARAKLAAWRARGVEVIEARLDVTDPAAVRELLGNMRAQGIECCSIFHAAGVLEDDHIVALSAESFRRVMAPKVAGAWNLHAALEFHGMRARDFILFSSASAVIGNSRQANYVAANAFLDAFAAYRRARGLAGTAINWGALAEVGMAAASTDVQRHLETIGMALMPLAATLHGLSLAMRFAPANVAIMDVDWPRWGKTEPHGARSLRFAHLTGKGAAEADTSLREVLRTLPEPERLELVTGMLVEQLAGVLRMPAERIDTSRRLNDMGFDSLMAVDLQVGLEVSFGVEFSTLELMRGQSIAEFAGAVLSRLGVAEACAAAVEAEATEAPIDVEALNEAELDRLLADTIS